MPSCHPNGYCQPGRHVSISDTRKTTHFQRTFLQIRLTRNAATFSNFPSKGRKVLLKKGKRKSKSTRTKPRTERGRRGEGQTGARGEGMVSALPSQSLSSSSRRWGPGLHPVWSISGAGSRRCAPLGFRAYVLVYFGCRFHPIREMGAFLDFGRILLHFFSVAPLSLFDSLSLSPAIQTLLDSLFLWFSLPGEVKISVPCRLVDFWDIDFLGRQATAKPISVLPTTMFAFARF